jgi:hypothetical protein
MLGVDIWVENETMMASSMAQPSFAGVDYIVS